MQVLMRLRFSLSNKGTKGQKKKESFLLIIKNNTVSLHIKRKKMNYGQKIINFILKKRAACHTIHHEFECKIQADSDRSNIGVFETGIPSQRHGNIGKSARNAEEEESIRIIKIAKEKGMDFLYKTLCK